MVTELLVRLRFLISRKKQGELDDEVRFHLEQSLAAKVAAGLTASEARRQALIEFGGVERTREQCDEQRPGQWMDTVAQDIRYGLRVLRKSPGFVATAVLTLALGIGANTAVFSALNALLLRMLPVRDPQQLYTVMLMNGGTQPPNTNGTGNGNTSFSFPVFDALRGQKRVFSDLIAHVPLGHGKVPVRYGSTPKALPGEEVSGNFFSGLGVPMAAGTAFGMEDERAHNAKVVLSYGFWTEAFARDPGTIGKTLYIKGAPFTIVGVTAPGFHGADPVSTADFWIPLETRPELGGVGSAG